MSAELPPFGKRTGKNSGIRARDRVGIVPRLLEIHLSLLDKNSRWEMREKGLSPPSHCGHPL